MSSNDENWNAIGKTYLKSLEIFKGVNAAIEHKHVLQIIIIWLDRFKKTLQSHILPFLNPDTPLFGNTFITFRNKSLSCKGV